MNLNKFFVINVVLCCFSQVTLADETGLTKQFSTCMDKSGGVTVNMLNCISAETEHQDARLNTAYKELMAQLSPARKKELQEVQRVWIKYRAANCDFYADPEGGTLATVSANDCFMSTTASRAKELEVLRE